MIFDTEIHFESEILTLLDNQSVDEFTKYSDFIWLQLSFGQQSCFFRTQPAYRAKSKYWLT